MTYDDAPMDGSAWVDDCALADLTVYRGGGWNDSAEFLRAAARSARFRTASISGDIGFRVARD